MQYQKNEKKAVRKQWRIDDAHSPLIMLPARFTRLKGQELFIKAFQNLKISHGRPFLSVIITKNPHYVSELVSLASSYGIKDRLIFGGFVSDMPAALSICDIVVSSS